MSLADEALVTLPEAKRFLEIPLTETTDDELLEELINSCSDAIESWLLGTLVVQRELVEEYERPSGRFLFLRHGPVASVSSIKDGANNPVAAADYLIFKEEAVLRHVTSWPRPVDSNGALSLWTVTYTAGKAADTDAVPARFKQAAKLLLSKAYRVRDADKASEKVGDVSLSWRPGESKGLPDDVKLLIQPDARSWV